MPMAPIEEQRHHMVERQLKRRGISDARLLEIGVGSGYAAAIMSRLARGVHAITRQLRTPMP